MIAGEVIFFKTKIKSKKKRVRINEDAFEIRWCVFMFVCERVWQSGACEQK